MLHQFHMTGIEDEYELSHSESQSHVEGGWDDENSPLSQSPASTPNGTEYPFDPAELERVQQSYAQFLQTMHGQGEIPPELADDDLEYHVDPESLEAVPPEWYDIDGKISRAEIEALRRDAHGNGSYGGHGPGSSSTTEPHSASSSSSSDASKVEYVELTTPQRNLLHQQVLQLFQLQVQVYLISRHIEGYSHISDIIWKQYNQFVALSTAATMSYRAPASHMAQAIPALPIMPPSLSTTGSNTSSSQGGVLVHDSMSLALQIPSPHPQHIQSNRQLSPHDAHALSPRPPSHHDPSSSHIISTGMDVLQMPGLQGGMISIPSPRPPQATDPGTISISMNNAPPKAPKSTGKKSAGGEASKGKQLSPTKREVPKPFLASVLALPTVALMHQESMARLHLLEGVLSKSDFQKYNEAYKSFFRENLAPKVDARATMSAMSTLSNVGGQAGMVVSTGSTARYKWTPAEDELLAIGFENFHKNWNLIHRRMLPGKDSASIATRFKNKTSKKSKENPIKTALVENTKPLTSHERDILTLGVSQMGQNFELIASTYLPSRKPLFLARLWRQMTAAAKTKKHLPHSSLTQSSEPSSSRVTRNRSGSSSSSSSSSSSDSSVDGLEGTEHHAGEITGDSHLAAHPRHGSHSEQLVQAHTHQKPRQRGSPSGSAENSDNEFDSSAPPHSFHTTSGVTYGLVEGDREDLTSSRSRNMALQRVEQQQQQQHAHDNLLQPGTNHHHPRRHRSASSMSSSSSDTGGSDLETGSAYDSSFDSHIIESNQGSDEDESGSFVEGGLTSSHDSDGVMNPPGMLKKRKLAEDGDNGDEYSQQGRSHYRNHPGHQHHHETTAAGVSEELLSAPFKAANYLEQLLKWEEIWQEEAVAQAIAAAEAAAAAKLSGKPKSTSKSKSKSKSKKDDPANMFANEWDHELWFTPPSTPTQNSEQDDEASSNAQGHESFEPSSDFSTDMPQPVIQIDSTYVQDAPSTPHSSIAQFERMMVDAETDQIENQLRMSAYAPIHAPTMDKVVAHVSGMSHDPQKHLMHGYPGESSQNFIPSQNPNHAAHLASCMQQHPQHTVSYMEQYQSPHHPHDESQMPQQRSRAYSGSSSSADPEFILMQKNLEKEVKHAQTSKTSGGKSSAKSGTGNGKASEPHHIQPSSVPPFASGMFSVLTPEGRVITSGSYPEDQAPPRGH
jgi:hypothetical protein